MTLEIRVAHGCRLFLSTPEVLSNVLCQLERAGHTIKTTFVLHGTQSFLAPGFEAHVDHPKPKMLSNSVGLHAPFPPFPLHANTGIIYPRRPPPARDRFGRPVLAATPDGATRCSGTLEVM